MIDEGDLLRRITRLERENRIIKSAVIAAVLLAVALFFVARLENGRRLVAKQLVVTDDAGNIVAQLGTSNRRTCLQLQGRADLTNAELCADKIYGAFLHLTSQNPGRAYLSAGERVPEGGYMVPGLIIEGEAGKGMLSFNTGAQAGAESELVFGRGVEDNSIMLSGSSDRPTIKVWGADGKALWTAP
jgi:hypothetical protein